jgi:hypothetical protein
MKREEIVQLIREVIDSEGNSITAQQLAESIIQALEVGQAIHAFINNLNPSIEHKAVYAEVVKDSESESLGKLDSCY